MGSVAPQENQDVSMESGSRFTSVRSVQTAPEPEPVTLPIDIDDDTT